ncbi:MAG: PAS domain S-box protein [Bacteroidota bacterium]
MEIRRSKILAIDDNQDNLISIRALIKESFPEALILTASNGLKGLELAAAEDPDVVLLDIVMPGMDGFEVCKQLKADSKLRDIPVVFVTALKGDKESRILALECGAEAFLAKPIDESELTAQVRAMIKIKNANIQKHREKEYLAALVAQRTNELNEAHTSTLKLLEDLRKENDARKMSEEALRESEERFRTVAQSANDAIITIDHKGIIKGWNRGAETIFGFFEAEMLGDDLTRIIPEQYHLMHKEGVRQAATRSESHVLGKTIELLGIHKSGKELSIELSMAEWETVSGKFYTGIIRDITQRRQAEIALRESEKRYRGLMNNLDAGVVVHAPDTSVIMSNPKASELLGLNDGQMRGTLAIDPQWQFVDETNNPLPIEKYPVNQIAISKKALKFFTAGVYRPSTSDLVWLMVNGIPVLDKNGEITEIIVSFIDITQRKRAEDALMQSEERYRTIFENVQDVFYQTNLEGEVLEISPSIKHFAEFNREEIIGAPVDNLYFDANDRSILIQEIQKNGELRDYEIKLKTKTGQARHASINARLIYDTKGNPHHIDGAIRDTSERKLAEIALQESEAMYRNLVFRLPDGVYKSTDEGRFVDVNPAMAKMLGYESVEELKAIDIKTQLYFKPSDRESVILKVDKEEIGVYRMKKKDGSEIWVEDHGWLNKDDSVNILFHEGIMRDVTERKRAEDAVISSEIRYRRLFESAKDGILILDAATGKIVDVNPFLVELLGYSEEQFIEKAIWEIGFLKDIVANEDKFLELQQQEYVRYEDLPLETADGRRINVEFISNVYQVDLKKVIQCNIRDISDRVINEKQLKLLSRAVAQSPTTVIITDKAGNIEYVNPKFTEVTGYAMEEVLGKNPRFLQSGEQSAEFYQGLWNAILSGKEWTGEFHNKKKNGDSYWESAAISSITDNANNISHFIAVKEDITEKKEMIRELVIAKERAEESDRLKSAFLANMSHEIRTPMNGILGFTSLLKEPKLTGAEQQEYIAIIEKSGTRMLNIINDIISISKVEAGQLQVNITETNISQQLDYIYTFFKPEVEQKGMLLLLKNSLTANEAIIQTDREKVYAILTNLVKNATKFTQTGFIEIGLDKKDNFLVFSIRDTGTGIPKEQTEIIFERFRQGSESLSRNYEGAGLGLAISRAYVEILGGKIWFESEFTKGTMFYFTIPSDTVSSGTQDGEKELADVDVKNPVNDLTILIAEDDRISEMLITMAVRNFSKKIIRASTGLEAVEACRINTGIDLVMMDMKMPKMSGYEATRQIREFNKDIVIFAQTAFGLSSEREKAMEAGCDEYISKPVNLNVLNGLIQKHFKKNGK